MPNIKVEWVICIYSAVATKRTSGCIKKKKEQPGPYSLNERARGGGAV